MSKSAKNSPVSLVQGVNVAMPSPQEVLDQQAKDTAGEAAEAHEKAVKAALPKAIAFVDQTALFTAWLAESEVNKEAFAQAKINAVKIATQDVDAELTRMRAEMAKLEAKKASAQSAFEIPSIKAPVAKGKPGRTAKAGKESIDAEKVLAVLTDSAQSVKEIAALLHLPEDGKDPKRIALAATLKTLVANKIIGTIGQKAGMKYLSA